MNLIQEKLESRALSDDGVAALRFVYPTKYGCCIAGLNRKCEIVVGKNASSEFQILGTLIDHGNRTARRGLWSPGSY
jgi:hypothetical protein